MRAHITLDALTAQSLVEYLEPEFRVFDTASALDGYRANREAQRRELAEALRIALQQKEAA